jgi:hypothetical protein
LSDDEDLGPHPGGGGGGAAADSSAVRSGDLPPERSGDGGIPAASASPYPEGSQTRYESNLERLCRQVSKTCAIASHSQ